MGIFCMVFGVVLFLGSVGGGYMVWQYLMGPGASWISLLSLPTSLAAYLAIFAFIGLMFGLSFFMKGLTHQKVCQIAQRLDEE